jgi:hypothetical protein
VRTNEASSLRGGGVRQEASEDGEETGPALLHREVMISLLRKHTKYGSQFPCLMGFQRLVQTT